MQPLMSYLLSRPSISVRPAMFTHAAQRTGLTQRQLYGHCRHSTTNPIYAMVSRMLGATVSVRSVHALHCPAALLSVLVRGLLRSGIRAGPKTEKESGGLQPLTSPPHRHASDYIYHRPRFLDIRSPCPRSPSFQTRPDVGSTSAPICQKAPRHSRELFDRWARKTPRHFRELSSVSSFFSKRLRDLDIHRCILSRLSLSLLWILSLQCCSGVPC